MKSGGNTINLLKLNVYIISRTNMRNMKLNLVTAFLQCLLRYEFPLTTHNIATKLLRQNTVATGYCLQCGVQVLLIAPLLLCL